jgi:hypothetical protein
MITIASSSCNTPSLNCRAEDVFIQYKYLDVNGRIQNAIQNSAWFENGRCKQPLDALTFSQEATKFYPDFVKSRMNLIALAFSQTPAVCDKPNPATMPADCIDAPNPALKSPQWWFSEFKFKGLPIDQAKVIFFPEHHKDIRQHKKRAALLNQVMRDGDVLLMEGAIFGIEIPSSERDGIQHKIKRTGWESADLFLPSFKKYLRLKEIEGKRFEMNPELHAEGWRLLREMNGVDKQKRNDAMVSNIHFLMENLKDGQRIFVIAGANHIEAKLLRQFENQHTMVEYAYPETLFGKIQSLIDDLKIKLSEYFV